MKPSIQVYADHNASTPVLPRVFEAMLPWLTGPGANPSGSHAPARAAREAIEAARHRVACLIGAQADEIVFTSGGTEANNLAILGSGPESVATSVLEHPSVLGPVTALDVPVQWLEVGTDGRAQGTGRADLTTWMLAHNETGVLQTPRAEGRLHVDAAQAVGKVPVDVDTLGADLLTIAGHKLNAPKGVGALYIRRGLPLAPTTHGASHERGLRPGTENVAGIVGLGAACELARLQPDGERQATLRDRLWSLLEPLGARRTGNGPWLPNTLHVCFPGQSGPTLLSRIPGLAASTGSACHADRVEPSASLLAMGLDRRLAEGAVRLSLGRTTTRDDVDTIARLIRQALGT